MSHYTHRVLFLCALWALSLQWGCGDPATSAFPDATPDVATDTATDVATDSPTDSAHDAPSDTTDTQVELTCPYDPGFERQVMVALDRADASGVSADDLMIGALHALELERARFEPELKDLLSARSGAPLDAITWDPTHDSAQLRATPGVNVPLLLSNANAQGPHAARATLAVLGTHQSARYVVFGGSPYRNSKNDQMDELLVNLTTWLTGANQSPASVVLSQLDESFYFKDESLTRAWFDAHMPGKVTTHEPDACDGQMLGTCAQDADLLIVSQKYDPDAQDPAQIVASVQRAMEAGISVLYLQHDGGLNPLGQGLLDLLQVGYVKDNYWDKLQLNQADATQDVGKLPDALSDIGQTLRRVRDRDVTFETASIREKPGDSLDYVTQIKAGQDQAKALLDGLNRQNARLFETCGQELPKLLALTGDALRRDVTYPLPVETSPTHDVLRAHLADHLVYIARAHAPAQPDRGNFDPKDLSTVEGITKELELVSREPFRSAGVYVLPGRTTTVTRLDDADVEAKVFVNSLRDGATKQWGTYRRPNYLRSQPMRIRPGESITFSTPHGGPMFVEFDDNDQTVRLKVERVGEHPVWRSSADDERFAEGVDQGTYNWVELLTQDFELHVRADRLAGSFDDPRWDTPQKLARGIERYTFASVYQLAGFSGRGIPQLPEVHGWAEQAGLEVAQMNQTKHANMDQAACGAGCSGNPYDASWSFKPIAHGDLHEMGHGVERGIFRLEHGSQRYGVHGVTNWWAFYAADLHHADTGAEVPDWKINAEHLFDALQSAWRAGERAGQFSDAMDTFLEDRIASNGAIHDSYAFYIQLMAAARHAGVVDNGYHLVPRLHILERAWRAAKDDPQAWEQARASIGMETVTQEQAAQLSPNDFIAMASSFAMGLDYTDLFDMWGVRMSAHARAQIAAHGLPTTQRVFFRIEGNEHKTGALSTSIQAVTRLPIDGATMWSP